MSVVSSLAQPAGAEPLVLLENVRFAWRAGAPAVLEVPELAIEPGERLFIRGPSGSGKSTLLSLIGGVVLPQEGDVRVLGHSLPALRGSGRDSFRVDHIGFVFQMFNLLPYLPLVENVELPCRFSKRRLAKACARSGTLRDEAERLLRHLELDPATFASRPVSDLSVGQQQRVAAARALIGTPELVVADEPTSALDADRRRGFLDLLFNEVESAGSTLAFVSHDASLEPMFDRAIGLTELNRSNWSD